jgi:tetratricopeptide (TPR) repeat protein
MRQRQVSKVLTVLGAVFFVQTGCSARAPKETVEYRSPAGVDYMALPDTGGAVARAESAVAAAPRNVDSIIALGLAQSGIREYREAIATFTRGIETAPNNAILYRWRGHRYLSVRELDSARADLDHGLALDSSCYGCWYHLGIVKYVTGDFDGAADAFAHALPLAPDSGERAGSIDWSWMSLSRAGRAAEAQAVLDQHPDSLPENYPYSRRIGLYRGEIQPEDLVTPADSDDVNLATLSYGLGNWYLVKGDTAKARDWFEASVASGGWPAFGFIASEAELRRLR